MTQFGDRVELDIFYVRKLDGERCSVDVATRFHQAAVLSGRTPEIAYEAFERVWLRPYGLPTLVAADPDGCFQGDFQHCLESHIAPSLHAVNNVVLSRGRSAFQAVFGKVTCLPGGLFMDSQALSVSPTTDPAATCARRWSRR